VLEAVFILLELLSPSRRIFISSHSLHPLWFAVLVLQRDEHAANVAIDEVVVVPGRGAPSPVLTRRTPAQSRCRHRPHVVLGRRPHWPMALVSSFTFCLRSTHLPGLDLRHRPDPCSSAPDLCLPWLDLRSPPPSLGHLWLYTRPLAWPLRHRSSSVRSVATVMCVRRPSQIFTLVHFCASRWTIRLI
jgi:hypothetical protein